MLSLFRTSDDSINIDGKIYPIDCNFNVILANLELSQATDISEVVKVKVALKNYLNLSDEELKQWDYAKQIQIYVQISQQLFNSASNMATSQPNTEEDKSAYSFSEDADFIFASFMKDYGINLIEMRNKMHWNEFKALFASLSKDTKIVEVMQIRSWKPSKEDSKEYIKDMQRLQRIYSLKTTQHELELIEIERKKMSLMTPEERREYAKQQLREGG